MAGHSWTRGDALSELPSVEVLAGRASGMPRRLAVVSARAEIAALRGRLLRGEEVDLNDATLDRALAARAAALAGPSLRPVINATGVVLHTNLGRAPLAAEAAEAAALAGASYTNLEYELDGGKRDTRQAHLEPLLRELSGAEAALAVNNNAAAVLLVLAALAKGGEVVVSRGQLIEIGGSFRIPEILVQSGARLVEVGTTNRTRTADYERAIGPETAALLRVHQSNFRTVGFTEETPLEELCGLGREHDLPVIDDLGSGALHPVEGEPLVKESVRAGASAVCCSADKLLGGPQAGLLFGSAEMIGRCRQHPLARALRIDKLQLAALEATLRLHRFADPHTIPTLRMLALGPKELGARAEQLAVAVGAPASVRADCAPAGGGALPGVDLEGSVCVIDAGSRGADALAAALRRGDPPVVARIREDRVVLDPRTIEEVDIDLVGELVRAALVAG